MEKPRRSIEENKRISVASISILVVILITCVFVIIFLLFSKSENDKKIESIRNEIETHKLELSKLKEREEEINLLLSNVENSSTYMNTQIENYKTQLPSIEKNVKDYSTKEKIAYLVIIDDKSENVDKAIEVLNNNKVLATFFTNNKEDASKIFNNGHQIGLYIDNEAKISNIKEEYKDILESYNPDLFMVSSNLSEKEISIDSFYQVKENSTSEGKRLLNQEGYISDVVETTAERDFLIIKINLSNSVGVSSINGIVTKLKEKDYIFLPIVSSSSLIEK